MGVPPPARADVGAARLPAVHHDGGSSFLVSTLRAAPCSLLTHRVHACDRFGAAFFR